MSLNTALLKNLSILFVEDDRTTFEETKGILELLFHEVVASQSAEEGYELYLRYQCDMILTDISLQEMSGLELVEAIREKNKKIPVVMFSSHSEKNILLDALKLNVSGYVLKPYTFESLTSALVEAAMTLDEKLKMFYFSEETYFDLLDKQMYVQGEVVKLGVKEQQLIQLFIGKHLCTLTKEEIVSSLWPLDDITDSALKSIFYRLRKKVGRDIIISTQPNCWKLNAEC